MNSNYNNTQTKKHKRYPNPQDSKTTNIQGNPNVKTQEQTQTPTTTFRTVQSTTMKKKSTEMMN